MTHQEKWKTTLMLELNIYPQCIVLSSAKAHVHVSVLRGHEWYCVFMQICMFVHGVLFGTFYMCLLQVWLQIFVASLRVND